MYWNNRGLHVGKQGNKDTESRESRGGKRVVPVFRFDKRFSMLVLNFSNYFHRNEVRKVIYCTFTHVEGEYTFLYLIMIVLKRK